MADVKIAPIDIKLPENIPEYVWGRIPILGFLAFVLFAPSMFLAPFKKYYEENKITSMVVAITIVQFMIIVVFFLLIGIAIWKGYF
jgi:hypothetical protein